jgi:TRAP-type uncharacterized transport system fused permease subunit
MGLIYGFVLLFGIGLPAQRAEQENVTAWWHPVLATLAIAGGAHLVSLLAPRLTRGFAIGTTIGCTIGIIGAPFWHHTNQEAALVFGLVLSVMMLRTIRRRINTAMINAPIVVTPPPTAPPAHVVEPRPRPTRYLGHPERRGDGN